MYSLKLRPPTPPGPLSSAPSSLKNRPPPLCSFNKRKKRSNYSSSQFGRPPGISGANACSCSIASRLKSHVRFRSIGREPPRVGLLTELIRNWTGAPRSPQRTWAENDRFRLLLVFDFAKSCGGLRPSYSAHVRCGERGAPVQFLGGFG